MAMAVGNEQRRSELRARLRTAGAGETPALPPLQPVRVKLRTSERANARSERLRELFADSPEVQSECLVVPGTAPQVEAGIDEKANDSAHFSTAREDSGGHRLPSSGRRSTGTTRQKALHPGWGVWGWSEAVAQSPKSPMGVRSRGAGTKSAMSMLEGHILQSSAIFPGHPCFLRRDDFNTSSVGVGGRRTAGNFTRKTLSPSPAMHRDHMQHIVPYSRDFGVMLPYATDFSLPTKTSAVRATRTATSTRPPTTPSVPAHVCLHACISV